MNEGKLIIGMPAGSLADPNRGGNLVTLLKMAGFPTKGYDQGGPTIFPLHTFLVGWDGRPQEFGTQLDLGEIDLAIGGDDWILERTIELKLEYKKECSFKRVLPLNRGAVRLVIIYNPEKTEVQFNEWLLALLKSKSIITMVAELPYLALNWFQKKCKEFGLEEKFSKYSIQKFKTPPKIDSGIVIYETWGKTEAKVYQRSVDLGLEITQSGSAIRNYGLQIGEEVMKSESAIYVRSDIKNYPDKYEIARMFLINLYGAMHAERRVLLFFNAPLNMVEKITDYLKENHLFADEPTINRGTNFAEFSVQLCVDDVKLPLSKVRYDLILLGARSLETVPLESSIPGLEVVDL
ncbi:MAG: hypothetical protein N3G21_12325 [Candidatus Hydrogenedentes bacterium]|nr:hypothetical protein [Candidatus Hydrogenedentota bacterium]